MKKTFEVRILNQRFHLKTENDENAVKQVSDYVNKVFNDIENNSNNLSSQNVAILGALNIAEQLFSKDKEYKEKIHQWKSRLEGLATKLSD